jgi:hypothetical protein
MSFRKKHQKYPLISAPFGTLFDADLMSPDILEARNEKRRSAKPLFGKALRRFLRVGGSEVAGT